MAAARIAECLLDRGFEAVDNRVDDLVTRWAGADISIARWGNSAEYLRRSGQQEDLDFVLGHVDDVDYACCDWGGEIRAVPISTSSASLSASSGPLRASVAAAVAESRSQRRTEAPAYRPAAPALRALHKV